LTKHGLGDIIIKLSNGGTERQKKFSKKFEKRLDKRKEKCYNIKAVSKGKAVTEKSLKKVEKST